MFWGVGGQTDRQTDNLVERHTASSEPAARLIYGDTSVRLHDGTTVFRPKRTQLFFHARRSGAGRSAEEKGTCCTHVHKRTTCYDSTCAQPDTNLFHTHKPRATKCRPNLFLMCRADAGAHTPVTPG